MQVAFLVGLLVVGQRIWDMRDLGAIFHGMETAWGHCSENQKSDAIKDTLLATKCSSPQHFDGDEGAKSIEFQRSPSSTRGQCGTYLAHLLHGRNSRYRWHGS